MKTVLFFGGLFLGVFIGAVLMALAAVSDDRFEEDQRQSRNQDK